MNAPETLPVRTMPPEEHFHAIADALDGLLGAGEMYTAIGWAKPTALTASMPITPRPRRTSRLRCRSPLATGLSTGDTSSLSEIVPVIHSASF